MIRNVVEECEPSILELIGPVVFQRRLNGHDKAFSHKVEHVHRDAVAQVTSAVDAKDLEQMSKFRQRLFRLCKVAFRPGIT